MRWPMQGKTSPPDYLTEAELIGLMEKHGGLGPCLRAWEQHWLGPWIVFLQA